MSALGKAMGLDSDKWLPLADRAVTALEKFVEAYAADVRNQVTARTNHERTASRRSDKT